MNRLLFFIIIFVGYGCSSMHEYAEKGNTTGMEKELKEKGKRILTEIEGSGMRPMSSAAEVGNIKSLKWLLDKGVDIDQPDYHKYGTPLTHAASEGHMDAVKFLLENGADIYFKNKGRGNWIAAKIAEIDGQPKMAAFLRGYKQTKRKKVKKEKENKLLVAEKRTFKNAKKAGTYPKYDNFLQRYPKSTYRTEAIKAMALLLNKDKKGHRAEAFLQKYPKGKNYLKPGPWLLTLGPVGMKVRDLAEQLKGGISAKILSAKVKNVNIAYKDFTFPEIKYLKKRGINDTLIEAMIEVTGRLIQDEKRALENKKHIAKVQELIDQSQKNVNMSSTGNSEEGGVGKVAVDCVKLKSALFACDKAPGFLAMACKATARSQFDCSL
jgi:hypothetical protein